MFTINKLPLVSGQPINYEQFKKCMVKYVQGGSKADTQKELENSFKMFDKDSNGTIDKKELKKVLTSLGEKMKDSEVDEMFAAADVNSDGKIQYKGEYNAAFTTKGVASFTGISKIDLN